MSGAVGGLIRPVDLPAHPFGFHPHYLPSPRCLFCHSIPSHICGSARGHSTIVLFGPARCFGTLHHRIQVGAPSCCASHVASPYLLARLPPRARIPAHFLLPPNISSPSPLNSSIFRLGRQFFAARAAFFAKDTPNLTATIRFAGAQSQNIRSIPAFSAQHHQWQAPANQLPALHDHRRKNEKCRVPSTHDRTV